MHPLEPAGGLLPQPHRELRGCLQQDLEELGAVAEGLEVRGRPYRRRPHPAGDHGDLPCHVSGAELDENRAGGGVEHLGGALDDEVDASVGVTLLDEDATGRELVHLGAVDLRPLEPADPRFLPLRHGRGT
jgi:hypothetical protein